MTQVKSQRTSWGKDSHFLYAKDIFRKSISLGWSKILLNHRLVHLQRDISPLAWCRAGLLDLALGLSFARSLNSVISHE
jgi:hypothetical protein